MGLLESLFLWLDQPNHFWPVVWTTCSLLILSALLAQFRSSPIDRVNGPLVFAALLAIALVSFRWPGCLNNTPGENPDESQMIAGAIILQDAPVFWASVDGTTHGPLAQWPLALLGSAGVRLDYTNARLFSVGLAWVVVACTWLTLRVIFGDASARLLVLPLALQSITTTFWDFTQYSSEHVVIALIAAATWLLISAIFGDNARHVPGRLALAGVLLGAIPFAKLQGVPIGLWIGCAGVMLLLTNSAHSWRERCHLSAWLIGGATIVPLSIAAMIIFNGIWADFWTYYIQSNLVYMREFPIKWSNAIGHFLGIARPSDNFMSYFLPGLWLLIGATIVGCLRWRKAERRFVIFTFGLLLVSLYAVIAPNRTFYHYLQFALGPLALAMGAVLGSVLRQSRSISFSWRRFRIRPLEIVVVVAFFGFGTNELVKIAQLRGRVALGRYTETRGKLARTPLAGMLRTITRADERVAMWGWEPHHFVEANRRHATREAHTALQIFQTELRETYRSRYIADLLSSNPPVFIDVVGAGSFVFTNRALHGHEAFPALAEHISSHYRFVGEWANARVYVRIDRVSALPWADRL